MTANQTFFLTAALPCAFVSLTACKKEFNQADGAPPSGPGGAHRRHEPGLRRQARPVSRLSPRKKRKRFRTDRHRRRLSRHLPRSSRHLPGQWPRGRHQGPASTTTSRRASCSEGAEPRHHQRLRHLPESRQRRAAGQQGLPARRRSLQARRHLAGHAGAGRRH
jgi:hypothetical protein